MEDRRIKVTDKRLFTADGELRDEFRGELEAAAEAPFAPSPPPPEPPSPAAPEPAPPRPPVDLPPLSPGLGASGFYDLLSLLADPIGLYLGDAKLPDGRTVENLDLAQLHIDLLEVLRQKTRGNLTAQESAVLEDLLYRVRVRYVQKRG